MVKVNTGQRQHKVRVNTRKSRQQSKSTVVRVKVDISQSQHWPKTTPVRVNMRKSRQQSKVNSDLCKGRHQSKLTPVKYDTSKSKYQSKLAPCKVHAGQVDNGQRQHWLRTTQAKVTTDQRQHQSK